MASRNVFTSFWRGLTPLVQGLTLLALVVALSGIVYVAMPWLLWAYNVEQAGVLMEQGLAWPERREADTLPDIADGAALEEALAHLAAAIRWRADHPHAYRLAAHIYMAREDWVRAAEGLERARQYAPLDRLLGWELGLVYEQLWHQAELAPRQPLLPGLAGGRIVAPDKPLETPYCKPGRPESCYAGGTAFIQPYAEFVGEPRVEAATLFQHAPSQVKYPLTLPSGQPALAFLVGLDPAARAWGSDGAMFQLWVEPRQGEAILLYERTVDSQMARRGWLPGWADLSPWAGQEVTLVFGIGAGPAGDAIADWYGWGDIALTTVEGAQYSALLPRLRMRQVWRAAQLSPYLFYLRGSQALAENSEAHELLERWYRRAQAME